LEILVATEARTKQHVCGVSRSRDFGYGRIVVRPICVSNAAGSAPHIAPQPESAYHPRRVNCTHFFMSARPPGLPTEAEEVSWKGFNLTVGPLYGLPDAEQGKIKRFAFVVAEKHMNSAGSVHGGMLMSFMDVAMSRTSRAVSGAPRCSTVSLACDFAGPGRLGDLIEAHIRVNRHTRTMVFLSGELRVGERVLLAANGLWKIAGAAGNAP
jgi:acyl-coenzyme A thioesterase PaaI-like protein